MAAIEWPEEIPPNWNSDYWEVKVKTDQFNGEMRWIHLISWVTGSQALRIANNVGETFNCPVRIIYGLDPSITLSSEE